MPMRGSTEKGVTDEHKKPSGRFSFSRILMGLVVGTACITPGLSGGVIAASAGLYAPALHAATHLHKEFRQSAAFLLPLGIGAAAGILLFGKVMEWLMAVIPVTVLHVFLGLVIGSLPSLVSEANSRGFKKIYLVIALLAFAVALFTEGLLDWALPPAGLPINPFTSFLGGAIIAAGTVIPGISSSFFLMQLGLYGPLLKVLADFNIPCMAAIAAGAGVTALVLVFAADRLFKRFHGAAYYTVIGLLAGSMVMVFPGFSKGAWVVLDVALLIACAAGCWLLMKKAPQEANRKHSN